MSPIEALAEQSQQQHMRYHQLYGTSPVRGDGLREVAERSLQVGQRVCEVRHGVLDLNFSTQVL